MDTLSATESNVSYESLTSKDRDVDHNRVAIPRLSGCDLGLAIDKKVPATENRILAGQPRMDLVTPAPHLAGSSSKSFELFFPR